MRKVYSFELKDKGWRMGENLVCYCNECKEQHSHNFMFGVYQCINCYDKAKEKKTDEQ